MMTSCLRLADIQQETGKCPGLLLAIHLLFEGTNEIIDSKTIFSF